MGPFNQPGGSLDPLDIQRRKSLAQTLMQMNMPQQGQMVSGHYVAPGAGQLLANVLGMYGARRAEKKADADLKQYNTQQDQVRDSWLSSMPSLSGGAQPTAEQYMQWATQGMKIDPKAAQLGMSAANMAMNRDQQAAARKEALEARQVAEVENRKHREDMARIQAGLRPEPLEAVLVPGSEAPVLMPRSKAEGMTPWNPAAAKSQKDIEEKQKGKESVAGIADQLKGYYDTLKEEGGIPTTEGNPLVNLAARVANTGPGQYAGSVFGTKAQQARESIAQTRPLLMAAIKNATGMSSQQLNSNAELQFYLQAATDPSKGYEANMEALGTLNKLYGLGLGSGGGTPPQKAIKRTGKINGRKVIEYSDGSIEYAD